MTERTDDYIKNMIRKMLVDEGWVRGEAVVDVMEEEAAYWRGLRVGEACDPTFADAGLLPTDIDMSRQ